MTMLCAAGMQYRMGSSALESELEMLEHERREIEIKTSITEMKEDISRLSRNAAETVLSDPLSPQRYSIVTGLASPDHERRSSSREVEAFDLDSAILCWTLKRQKTKVTSSAKCYLGQYLS